MAGDGQVADLRTESSGTATADGAELYFERRGEGPPLLLIAGGGGDCGAYWPLANELASYYTVLTYDRRGNSRSPLQHAPAEISMAEQSADAVAVLRACGFGSGLIFGNSGGATIALDLAASHAEAVAAVVAHEPPLPRVLPGAGAYLAGYDEIARVLDAEGWQAAFRRFQEWVAHVPADELPTIMTVLLDPARILPPGPHLDLMQRLSGNWEYMTRFEIQPFIHYQPDLDQIAANGSRVALAAGQDTIALAGRDSLGQDPFHRSGLVIAERLGAEFAVFPGGHLAPAEIPGRFAEALRDLLARLR